MPPSRTSSRILSLPSLCHCPSLADRLRNAVSPVEHDQALHAQPLGQHGAQVLRALRRLGGVVGGDQPAHGDAPEQVHLRQHGVEDFAADVLEIHVDPVRRGGFQIGGQVAGLVVDAGIEAQFLGDVAAFLSAARDADGAASLDLGDLADQRADRTRCRRDHHRLARLGLAHLEQAEVGGPSRHAEPAHPALQRRLAGSTFTTPLPLEIAYVCTPSSPCTASPTLKAGLFDASIVPTA